MLLAKASPGGAQPIGPAEGTLALVSDYRYRGVSQTGGRPTLQASVDAPLGDAWQLGGWASSIGNGRGRVLELAASATRTVDLGGWWQASASAEGYLYPAQRHNSYVQLAGSLQRAFGWGTAAIQVSRGGSQFAAGTGALYVSTSLASAVSERVRVQVSGGVERALGRYKLDWQAEVGTRWHRVSLAAAVVGSNMRHQARARSGVGLLLTLGHDL